jgi:hypothetical protein
MSFQPGFYPGNLQNLEQRLTRLEEQLATLETLLSTLLEGKKIRFGITTLEWTAKGKPSAVKEVVTGLAKIESIVVVQTAGRGVIMTVSVAGGTAKIQGESIVELEKGLTSGAYWIAVGE